VRAVAIARGDDELAARIKDAAWIDAQEMVL
jgi:hypothetical protein